MQSVSSDHFRDGMRFLTGAVTIVTTDGEKGRGGFTATAVASVTDEPPTVLVCINKQNQINEIIKDNGVFAINVLKNGAEDLSNRFAGFDKVPFEQRLEKGNWKTSEMNLPVLEDALVTFECRLQQIVESGTHNVVFGEVKSVIINEEKPPLLYFNRAYTSVLG
ncbi:flavin reductase family protein [Flexithrix dorotheae]|uniref:flavin reductase family protein n=1 Tax=Flexithrix dorotheae TaxID=70993 RepID=UPI00037614D7|nr:flavin reductase family protein [Flexithrix dorotheae]